MSIDRTIEQKVSDADLAQLNELEQMIAARKKVVKEQMKVNSLIVPRFVIDGYDSLVKSIKANSESTEHAEKVLIDLKEAKKTIKSMFTELIKSPNFIAAWNVIEQIAKANL